MCVNVQYSFYHMQSSKDLRIYLHLLRTHLIEKVTGFVCCVVIFTGKNVGQKETQEKQSQGAKPSKDQESN